MQDGIKILSNATYGVFGTNFYRYTNLAIAESITSCARTEILKAFDVINQLGYHVLHSHTDSVFIAGKDDATVEELLQLANDITKRVSSGQTILQVDKIFKTWFNHGAQTAYFGKAIWPREEFIIRGYATRRRDSCELQRDYLNEAMKIILEEDVNQVYKFFARIHVDINNAREKGFDKSKLIFTKTVKEEQKYDNPEGQAGVKAVRKYIEYGYPFIPGQRISWIVIGKRDGRLDVEPVIEGRELPNPDTNHYIDRVIRTLEPIAEVFGFDKVALKTGKIQDKGWFSDQ